MPAAVFTKEFKQPVGGSPSAHRKNLAEAAVFNYQVYADANGIRQPFDGPLGNDTAPYAAAGVDALTLDLPGGSIDEAREWLQEIGERVVPAFH